jgi:hypothetical protein
MYYRMAVHTSRQKRNTKTTKGPENTVGGGSMIAWRGPGSDPIAIAAVVPSPVYASRLASRYRVAKLLDVPEC